MHWTALLRAFIEATQKKGSDFEIVERRQPRIPNIFTGSSQVMEGRFSNEWPCNGKMSPGLKVLVIRGCQIN
jgi:hypothetical protein